MNLRKIWHFWWKNRNITKYYPGNTVQLICIQVYISVSRSISAHFGLKWNCNVAKFKHHSPQNENETLMDSCWKLLNRLNKKSNTSPPSLEKVYLYTALWPNECYSHGENYLARIWCGKKTEACNYVQYALCS